MFAVFAAFVPEGDTNIKPIALGLAVGVFVDAFIVRMTLVPAVLQLLGEKAWWMPRWLDRILPSFDVEGDGLQKELELANWPEGGENLVSAADGLTVSTRKRRLVGDVSFRLADGEVLVVHGDDRTAAVALLMAVTGRTPVDGGTAKVAGLVLPVRGAAVRSRTAIVRLDAAETPVEDLRHALAGRPQLLALDAVDSVTDPIERRRIRAELTAALSRARVEERPFALVVSCVEPEGLEDLLPESAEPTEVDLSAGPGPRAVTVPDLPDPDRAEHGAHLEKTNA
jgi:RND superfamily putative drug exporter